MKQAEDFDAFVAIVDAGSVSEAARVLGVPRATLSRQLSRLETRLGARLLHRSTRRMMLTTAGEQLYGRARALVDGARAAVESVQRLDDTPRGLLRVSAPPMLTTEMGRLFAKFMHRCPEVVVELDSGTRHVDLVAEQVDVAIRAGIVREPSLIARVLFQSELIAVASPEYLAKHGTPTTVEMLAEHRCFRGFEGGARPSLAWPLRAGGSVRVEGPLVTNDLMTALGAVIEGLGIGVVPRALAAPDLERGRVVPVLEDTIGAAAPVSLVWVEREFIDPKVRAFAEVAVEWASLLELG